MSENVSYNQRSVFFSEWIDLIPDPGVVVDSDGNVVAANKVVGKYLGYEGKEIVGKNFLKENLLDKRTVVVLAESSKNRLKGLKRARNQLLESIDEARHAVDQG